MPPSINKNLFSGSSLCRDGYNLVFESNKVVVSKCGLFIGKGYDSGGMVVNFINKDDEASV
jgi:hypothetical protein